MVSGKRIVEIATCKQCKEAGVFREVPTDKCPVNIHTMGMGPGVRDWFDGEGGKRVHPDCPLDRIAPKPSKSIDEAVRKIINICWLERDGKERELGVPTELHTEMSEKLTAILQSIDATSGVIEKVGAAYKKYWGGVKGVALTYKKLKELLEGG